MGTWAFLAGDRKLIHRIAQYFCRYREQALCLKIWQYPIHTELLSELNWGRYFNMEKEPSIDVNKSGSLLEALKVQQFASGLGLAPPVFGIFVLMTKQAKFVAILTQHPKALPAVAWREPQEIVDKIDEMAVKFGFDRPWGDVETANNFINGRLIDWQHAKFSPQYTDFLREFYLSNTQFGASKYQTASPIGVTEGIRDSDKRISDLGLDMLEFSGSTILDLGCNGGQMLNYALTRGARFGLGIDWPKVIQAAAYLSNYLGHFNVQYLSHALHEGLPYDDMPLRRFDYVLNLSMVTHIGVPDYLTDLSKIMVIEINHPEQVEMARAALAPNWNIAEMGKSTDHGDRTIWHCYNKAVFGGYVGSGP